MRTLPALPHRHGLPMEAASDARHGGEGQRVLPGASEIASNSNPDSEPVSLIFTGLTKVDGVDDERSTG